jgi:RHS repeat-associated protein
MKSRLVSILLFLIFLAAPQHLRAQGDAAANLTVGLTPYQSFHGGDIDSINLSNGVLNLHVPIASFPERGGKLGGGVSLIAAGTARHETEICNPMNVCTFLWQVTGNIGPEIILDGQFGLAVKSYQASNKINYLAFAATTSDGSKHPLIQTSSNAMESVDATGYASDGNRQAEPTYVIDRNGTRLLIGGSGDWEDSNGNQISSTADTLGRNILTYTATSDYSGCTTPEPIVSAGLVSLPYVNGGTYQIKMCDATIAINFNGGSSTETVLQSVVLPNGTAWTFQYTNDRGSGDPQTVNWGELTQITLPTGGTINYTYEQLTGGGCSSLPTRWISSRTINANDGTGAHTWTYTYQPTSGSTVVTDPMGNDTAHSFTTFDCGVYETQVKSYQGSATSGTLLKTVQTDYNTTYFANPMPLGTPVLNIYPIRTTTTWPNGKVTKVEKDYDAGFTCLYCNGRTNAQYGNVVAEREYDYGSGAPGSLLRTTTTNYLAFSNSTYLTNNLLDPPSSVQITDGGGTQRAYTTYGYDEYGLQTSGIGATQQHDLTPVDGTQRGNLTSVHRWLNGSATATTNCNISVSNGYLISYKTYYDTGMVYQATDPCGSSAGDTKHTSTYAYSSTDWGAYLTTITNPLGQSTINTYDFNTGLVASSEDPNLQTTSFTYDNMWRLASASYPDGGSAAISRQESSFPFSATLTRKITASQNYVTANVFDGLGRVSQSQLTSDAPSTTFTVTTYDALGRKGAVYNPTRCNPPTTNCGESTWGYAIYAYDGLSRLTQVTQPDGSVLQTSYTGNSTTVTDEAGKKRTMVTDGLGRLSQVFEDPSGLNYGTVYQYDALDDLTNVTQSSSRQRTFVYDSLKRLTSASNPESGTVAYTYDADGNVITKLDARSIRTTYSYDQLNRVLSKTYTDSTPTVTYAYDGNTPVGCTTGVSSYGLAIGRRTAMCDGPGFEAWTYNDISNTGWQITDKRNIKLNSNTATESIITQNNLAGTVATLTYPSGRTITYSDNGAMRPISAQDVADGITYGSSGTYAPPGELNALSLGASVKVTNIFNTRLQPCWIYGTTSTALPGSTLCSGSATTGNIIDLKYGFALGATDNGNVISITNDRVPNRSQSFLYDSLNRITTASTTATHATDPTDCWGEAYIYDVPASTGPWGNLIQINPASSAYTGCTQESFNQTVTAYNQISGWCYDLAGNLQMESASPCPSPTYSYNAENQLISTAGITYQYDGDGKRVSKSNGKLYWYDGGDPIAETDAFGNTTDEYIFFGGRRIARRDSAGNIVYYMADHLGTSRIVTNAAGSILDESDFYPFGGERVITASSGNTYKFTGKERDTESDLDNFGARYTSSSIGRFMSPDPAGVLAVSLRNPQTWNWYAYTMNNPLRYTDPTGKYTCADSKKCDSALDQAFEKARQRDLQSHDKATAAAAKAYGDPNTDNHVGVAFISGDKGFTNLSVSWKGDTVTSQITVQIPGGHVGIALDEDVGHEGTHVGQDQALAASFKADGSFDHSLNLTSYDAENAAYHVNAAIIQASGEPRSLDPLHNYWINPADNAAQVNQTINRFLADPANGYNDNRGVTPQSPGPTILESH